MELLVDRARLGRLCGDLSLLSGVRVRVLGSGGEPICESGLAPAFCARCHSCDLYESGEVGQDMKMLRCCHEGLCAIYLPVSLDDRDDVLAWLCAGPFRDATYSETQIMPGSLSDYAHVPKSDAQLQEALSGLMEAVCDSIRMRTLIRPAAQSDLMRLKAYIDAHYMEKISLSTISVQLHIGRTRLCTLAKELSGGATLTTIISNKRIEAAQALLTGTNNPVWAIAESVGISDYNYFSKIFRAAVGISPSQYRKRFREAQDDRQESGE